MSRLDPFWDVMCQYREFIWLGVMVVIFLAILTVISILFAPPGSASAVVAWLNLILVVILGTAAVLLYRRCVKYEQMGY